MKTVAMLKPELEERSYGSSFDPVLTGVAHGLARMLPPIDHPGRSEYDADPREQDLRIGETNPAGNPRRS